MAIQKFQQPDSTTESPSVFGGKVDASLALLAGSPNGNMFACHEQTSPNMTIRVEGGVIIDGITLTVIAAQSTGTITAPTTNPRIDRIVMNILTQAVSIVTGTQAASPTAPAISADSISLCQVRIETSSSIITNSMITEERAIRINLVDLENAQTISGTKTFSANVDISKTNPLLDINDTSNANYATLHLGYANSASSKYIRVGPTNVLQIVNTANTLVIAALDDTGIWTVGTVPLARIEGYDGSSTTDVGSIADDDAQSFDVTVTGAALGDYAMVSHSLAMPHSELVPIATVRATNTVTVQISNHTGVAQDPDNMTYYVKVIKK